MFRCPRFADERGRWNDALYIVIGLHKLVEEIVKSEVNLSVANGTIRNNWVGPEKRDGPVI